MAMPLEHAWLCVNCDSVGNQQERCPICAAPREQLLSMAHILNRKYENVKAEIKRLREALQKIADSSTDDDEMIDFWNIARAALEEKT